MNSRPQVRARHLKSLIAAIDRMATASLVRSRIAPAVLAASEGATSIDWLPFELDLAITRAVYLAVPTQADAFFRAHTNDSFSGPLLQGIVGAGVRLFGLHPGSWARWVPRGWSLVFRDAGEWSISEAKASECHLALLHLPPMAVEDQYWIRSVARSLDALCDLAKCIGRVDVVTVDPASRRAEFLLRWSSVE